MQNGLFDTDPSLHFKRRDDRLTREKALNGSADDKYQFVENVSIAVDSFQQARKFIDALLERSRRAKRPGGLWVIGEGGVGKSFILNDIHKRYAPIDTDKARVTPVLSLAFGQKPAVSSILIHLLLQLGQDPDLLSFKNNKKLEDIFVDALPESGTLAILFDESQHLWLRTTTRKNLDRKGGELGDFLKKLYDRISVAFIFSGTPGLREIFESDTQANTRWSGTIRLKPFEFDSRFVGVLTALDQAIPMHEPANLSDKKLAEKLHFVTLGNFRLLKRLLAESVYLAAKDGAKKIQIKHLADAHFHLFCDRENPFK